MIPFLMFNSGMKNSVKQAVLGTILNTFKES